MSHWTELPLLSLDCETTGVDVFEDRIVEIAAAVIDPDGDVPGTWSRIVNPGVLVPDAAAQVHGITTERAATEGVTPVEALTYVAVAIQNHLYAHDGHAGIVIYNATFDLPLLLTEAERHGVDFPPVTGLLDPYLIDRLLDRFRKGKRQLAMVAAHYGVELTDADAHSAAGDAVAAGRVMQAMVKRYPQLRERSLGSMWLRQVQGHEALRVDFAKYMRDKVDPKFESTPGWPIPVARERAA